ncbi:hypothetical protein, partial [Candidatus Anaplasma sp. TIGMIC]|uniref:hypothetical protein n=1 Tax=Candidatus Anaplasma sp. TIGMIC TaxID=3020713 RepID=UPI00232B0495
MATRCSVVLLSVALWFCVVFSVHGSEVEQEECKPVYQSASDSPMVASSHVYEDRDNARIRVCGAKPACSSCQEMAPGDCRYIFPTYVMAYASKNGDGKEKVCACQVFACKLPWDPLGWSGKCMSGGELGCYAKPANRDTETFPESMCAGVDDSIRVKFVPMAFALQDYT